MLRTLMLLLKRYFIKSPKDTHSELNIVAQNPIINNSSSDYQIIKEYLRLHQLSFEYLLNWSCPVCLETLNSPDMSVCIPFKCSHPICFSCLKSWCSVHRRGSRGSRSLSCCLCRRQSSDIWYNSLKIYSLTTTYLDNIITVVFPSDLDYRYLLREDIYSDY